MMPKAVYVGRFCPLHIGHMEVINMMISQFAISNCLVFIGSCNSPISWRVLFTYADRRRWLRKLYPSLKVIGMPDVPGNDSIWLQMIDDYIECVFGPHQDITFFGGSTEDILFFHNNHRKVKIHDREINPVSATSVRQLLLLDDPIVKFVDPRISNEVRDVFRKRIKMLDELRQGT